MPDPFTPCPQHNRDDLPCWLVKDHRRLCEVHPSDRKKTGQPVWSSILAGEPFHETAVAQWRRESGIDPITGECA